MNGDLSELERLDIYTEDGVGSQSDPEIKNNSIVKSTDNTPESDSEIKKNACN